MSVTVSMPQLGESVTEGTVTRWLKRAGEHVDADEPLLEVSTDKVDTEIPSPVSGILRGITVAEDETVAVGAELAVIDEDGSAGAAAAPPAPAAQAGQEAAAEPPAAAAAAPAAPAAPAPTEAPTYEPYEPAASYEPPPAPSYQPPAPSYQPPAPTYQPPPAPTYQPPAPTYQPPAPTYQAPAPTYQAPAPSYEPPAPAAAPEPVAPPEPAPAAADAPDAAPAPAYQPAPYPPLGYDSGNGQTVEGEAPYVTPLVRKLAAEHGIDLADVTGTGVGGRIRKQDVLEAAARLRGPAAPAPAPAPAAPAPAAPQFTPPAAPPAAAPAAPAAAPPVAAAAPAPSAEQPRTRPAIVPSSLRGTTERMSRARQVIAQRMIESLQTSAQLTTVVEADVTLISRLRDRAKAAFEAREGVKLSFLPFFALATVEALKIHPKLNAVIDTASGQVTYHDAEHLGIAVDTERGLMVPVIRNAGDLNIGGLARKIADLAGRTRAGQVSPDELAGGTFTLTNTGSRGALFDTPIINQPQVGILGTGSVVKRAVVVEDPTLGEVITVRAMIYLALTYDHRLVDGADAARFLLTIKDRLEEGAFEAELGL
jgi:pyruvate dehydrogenase E2 component (dihydrolipoamide acetyltransferase)